jgi:hypothetical protein
MDTDTLTLTPVLEPEELRLDEQRPRMTVSVSRARCCAAGMHPYGTFISLNAFGYGPKPRFLTDRLARSVVRQLTEAHKEAVELIDLHREPILLLAERIFTARRLSDDALRDALIEAIPRG